MTPIQIECLLHYSCRADDWRNGTYPPAGRDALLHLIGEEMLSFHGFEVERFADGTIKARYKLTERGRAYVDALQRVPLPEQSWVIPAQAEWRSKP